jgi:hypothetical protein
MFGEVAIGEFLSAFGLDAENGQVVAVPFGTALVSHFKAIAYRMGKSEGLDLSKNQLKTSGESFCNQTNFTGKRTMSG